MFPMNQVKMQQRTDIRDCQHCPPGPLPVGPPSFSLSSSPWRPQPQASGGSSDGTSSAPRAVFTTNIAVYFYAHIKRNTVFSKARLLWKIKYFQIWLYFWAYLYSVENATCTRCSRALFSDELPSLPTTGHDTVSWWVNTRHGCVQVNWILLWD